MQYHSAPQKITLCSHWAFILTYRNIVPSIVLVPLNVFYSIQNIFLTRFHVNNNNKASFWTVEHCQRSKQAPHVRSLQCWEVKQIPFFGMYCTYLFFPFSKHKSVCNKDVFPTWQEEQSRLKALVVVFGCGFLGCSQVQSLREHKLQDQLTRQLLHLIKVICGAFLLPARSKTTSTPHAPKPWTLK